MGLGDRGRRVGQGCGAKEKGGGGEDGLGSTRGEGQLMGTDGAVVW